MLPSDGVGAVVGAGDLEVFWYGHDGNHSLGKVRELQAGVVGGFDVDKHPDRWVLEVDHRIPAKVLLRALLALVEVDAVDDAIAVVANSEQNVLRGDVQDHRGPDRQARQTREIFCSAVVEVLNLIPQAWRPGRARGCNLKGELRQ